MQQRRPQKTRRFLQALVVIAMKNVAYIFLILGILSCTKEQGLPAGLRAGGFKLADEFKQEQILNEMNEMSIPFEIDERGFVRYMQNDVAEVRKIIRGIHYEGKDSQFNLESEIAQNEAQLALYEEKFKEKGIPYDVEPQESRFSIVWRVAYADKVDQIVEDIGFEFHKLSKNN